MKSRRILAILAAVLLPLSARAAGDLIVPPYVAHRWFQTNTANITYSTTYFTGSSFTLSNILFVTTGGTTQGLNNVTVEFRVGTTDSNLAYTATTYPISGTAPTNAAWVTFPVPSLTAIPGTAKVQAQLTDYLTNSAVYPQRVINRQAALQ